MEEPDAGDEAWARGMLDGAGERVVLSSFGKTVKIFDAATGKLRRALAGEGDGFYAVAGALCTMGAEAGATIRDPVTFAATMRVAGHAEAIAAAAFSPDGELLLTGAEDGSVGLWRVAPDPAIARAATAPGAVGVAWDGGAAVPLGAREGTLARAGARALVASGTRLEVREGERVLAAIDAGEPLVSAALDAAGTRVLGVTDDAARVWNVAGGELALRFAREGDWAEGSLGPRAALTPDGERLLAALASTDVTVLDVDAGTRLGTLSCGGAVNALVVAPDGRHVAVLGASLKLYDLTTLRATAELAGHTDRITSITFDGAGGRLLTTSLDGTARIWDVPSGTLRATLLGHDEAVWAGAWGEALVATAGNDTVRVWDAATGRLLATREPALGQLGWVGVSPDGKRVAAGGEGAETLWSWTLPPPPADLDAIVRCRVPWQVVRGVLVPAPDAQGCPELR
jgi:WD40 repeat protein